MSDEQEYGKVNIAKHTGNLRWFKRHLGGIAYKMVLQERVRHTYYHGINVSSDDVEWRDVPTVDGPKNETYTKPEFTLIPLHQKIQVNDNETKTRLANAPKHQDPDRGD